MLLLANELSAKRRFYSIPWIAGDKNKATPISSDLEKNAATL
jgi:hypothetical protein